MTVANDERTGHMRELILGGQRSGKSRCAEARAAAWLAGGADGARARSACLVATALPGDAEMRERIARHRADRAARVPALASVEAPLALAEALHAQSAPERLVIVDCLTLWLTNLLMPGDDRAPLDDAQLETRIESLIAAVRAQAGPLVLVSNEIGLGISPLGAPVRRFVDELGRLHQRIAAVCSSVTWMVAGIEVPVKRAI